MKQEHIAVLDRSAQTILTQDNRCTAEPIFVVQQRKRLYGVDPDIVDDSEVVWLDGENDCQEIDGEERERLEALYQDTFDVPGKYHRTGYVDQWEFVQPFFTEAAAVAYIEANLHRLTDPRIYVDSAYRNPEWQAVRAMICHHAAEEARQ